MPCARCGIAAAVVVAVAVVLGAQCCSAILAKRDSWQMEADCLCQMKLMGVTGWGNVSVNPCTFSTACDMPLKGVTCWSDYHLMKLELSYEPMVGSLPSCVSAFGNITEMVFFACGITGPLPDSLGNLTTLQLLRISNSALSGTIPTTLSQLVNLRTLALNDNWIGGTLDTLAPLPFLQRISLCHNAITGTMPDFHFIGSLIDLDLQSNKIHGSIPTSFGNAQSLWFLDLRENNFTGTIPSSLFRLPANEILLSTNSFSGPFPNVTVVNTGLRTLVIDYNGLTSLPESISNLSNLVTLSIFQNEIRGTIPASLSSMSSLTYINLGENSFSGSLPALSSLTQINSLYLGGNHFDSQIPTTFCLLQMLQNLDVSVNNITGGIPACFSSLSSLTALYLNDNSLQGTIPLEIGNMSKLQILHLQQNDISGTIPETFGNLSSLRDLSLRNTDIGGTIPSSLSALGYLQTLNLEATYVYGETSKLSTIPYCTLTDACVDCATVPTNCICNRIDPKPAAVCSCVSAGSCYIDTVCYGPGIPPPSRDCARGCFPGTSALIWSDVCSSVKQPDEPRVTFGLQLVFSECISTLPSTFGSQFSQDIASALGTSSDYVYVNSISLRMDSSCTGEKRETGTSAITVIMTDVSVNFTIICVDFTTDEVILIMEDIVIDENSDLYQGNVTQHTDPDSCIVVDVVVLSGSNSNSAPKAASTLPILLLFVLALCIIV
ncbi:Protein kinase domain [Pelomyxa schiedti]|nr:Protein kinase domain [Pelomyxa schiedti]